MFHKVALNELSSLFVEKVQLPIQLA
jgi:hypothetical protein